MILLRQAETDDLDAIARIEEQAFESDRLSPRSILTAIRSASQIVIVAEGAASASVKRVVGYGLAHLRKGSRRARLASLATAREKPRGCGRALMAGIEDAVRLRGCASLYLEVRADNDRAINLYRDLGFREIGLYEDYYEDGESALRFEKDLPPLRGR